MATRRDARCASRNLVGGITAATSVAAAVSACELRATVSRERLAARIGEDHSTDLAGMDGDIERTQAPHAFHRFGLPAKRACQRDLNKSAVR